MEENKVETKLFEGFNCFLGLDLSLTATGCSVFHHKSGVASDYTTTLSSPHKGPQRLSDFASQLEDVKDAILAHTPAEKVLVCIENYAFSRFGKIVHLGELGGVVKYILFSSGISNIIVFPPTTLKKFATGKGVGEKGLIMTAVLKRWQIDSKNNNEADAYVLSRMGHCLCHPSIYTSFQKDASKKFQLA